MEYSCHAGYLAVRTPFNERYDLTQIFSGVTVPEEKPAGYNCPVDFHMTGLVRRERSDLWHVDRVLAYGTDEVPPVMMGGGDVGANHGFTCLVAAELAWDGGEAPKKDDVLTDAEGHLWRVMRRETSPDGGRRCGYLLLGRRLPGPLTVFSFPREIPGPLTDGQRTVTVVSQRGGRDLAPIVRHRVCRVDPCDGGVTVTEIYDILDPGYLSPENKAADEWMIRVENRYSVAENGQVTVDFSYRNLTASPIRIDNLMGIMYQERCDQGGGIFRTIPGAAPFKALCEDGLLHELDFSKPTDTAGPIFPAQYEHLTADRWADPSRPPISQRDELYDGSGKLVCTFEAGFESRPRPVTEAWQVVPSRKTYPIFADQFDLAPGEEIRGRGWRRWGWR